MNKRMSKRQRDIKSKLMAAISMLLVSSIMMVSSTYAWFTLSTAPEVTGITTAVGANGNLEMALQPLNGNSSEIKSDTGDSTYAWKIKNTTWGNIVDLSDTTTYGLDKITLYPAKLNTTDVTIEGEAGKQIKANPLTTPQYGSDGRMSGPVEKTITGVYTQGAFDEDYTGELSTTTVENAKGVRAVGISSGMSARQLMYRAAVSAASTAGSQAKSKAAYSLQTYGDELAQIAINHALASDDESYTLADVQLLQAVVNDLLDEDDGALTQIKNALLNYILANSIANAGEETATALQTAFAKATLETVSNIENVDIPEGFKDVTTTTTDDDGNSTTTVTSKGYISILSDVISEVESARDTLKSLAEENKESYTWDEISPALSKLVNTSTLTINGKTVDYVKANTGEMAGSIMKNGLNLTMATGSGVYSDIADFCGDYSATIIIPEVTYNNTTVEDVEATMNTDTSVDPVYLKRASGEVATYVETTTGASTAINDFYGYIIDLAFKTNAADSYLQLQADAIDRIYDGRTDIDLKNENTMGGGASMNFKATSSNFLTSQLKNLMKAIRVVFFDTDTQNIIGYARLDATSAVDETDGSVTMKLAMTDASGNAVTVAKEVTVTDESGTSTITQYVADPTIMELTQNTVHELSVLVYLDGEAVTNADVAYDAVSSMTGTMNLQFSSSATLMAMEYTDLVQGVDSSSTATTAPAVTGTITPTVTIADSITDLNADSVSIVALTDSGFGFTVTGYDATKHVVAVTINDGTSVNATYVDGTGFAVVTDAEVTSVAISITAATTTEPSGG